MLSWKKGIVVVVEMSYRGTYGDEVLCSSPVGSIIEISTDGPQKSYDNYEGDEINEYDGETEVRSSLNPLRETELNVYSYNAISTQDLLFKEESSKEQSNRNIGSNNIISISSGEVSKLIEDEDEEDSGLLEISQKDYLNSQKFKNDETIQSSSQVFHELKSAQTPQSSPRSYIDQIQSSSPIITQHETQPTSSQSLLPNKLPEFNTLAPSAQLTSFRMQSPKKIISQRTTPNKKRNILVTEESFNIPNLISPSKSSPLRTQITETQDSQSLYCTARQSSANSPIEKIQYEKTTSAVKFKGKVNAKSSSPFVNYQTRVIPTKRDQTEIPDSSDDENDISIIEITRTVKKPKKSILQVPSSPGVTSPLKSKSTKASQTIVDEEYDQISTEELKRKIIQYGLKPAKSRIKMIQSIKEVTSFLKEDTLVKLSQSQNITDSQNMVKVDVYKTIDEVILDNPKILEKIYTFEPIETKELNDFLNSKGITLSTEMLKDWCDRNSICLIEEPVEKKKKKETTN